MGTEVVTVSDRNPVSECIKKHLNDHIICSCGEKCYLNIFIGCGTFVRITAKCRKCDKGASVIQNVSLIDCACFDMVDYLIEKLKKQFNAKE